MAALAVAAHDSDAAHGYLIELVAWCAFTEREPLPPTSAS
jgi:hypothetical protein